MKPIILNDVHKTFTSNSLTLHIFEGLDLTLDPKAITVLLGKSGSGKTTLLRMVADLDSDYTGEIIREDLKFGYVFQEAKLLPWLTVTKNLELFTDKGFYQNTDIENVLQEFDLLKFAHFFPKQLSGGMKQRVAIARAILAHPSYILMDEPFSALDYFTRRKLQEDILHLKEVTDCGILFVTHSIEEALTIADRILVIKDGQISNQYKLTEAHPRNIDSISSTTIKQKILNDLEGE